MKQDRVLLGFITSTSRLNTELWAPLIPHLTPPLCRQLKWWAGANLGRAAIDWHNTTQHNTPQQWLERRIERSRGGGGLSASPPPPKKKISPIFSKEFGQLEEKMKFYLLNKSAAPSLTNIFRIYCCQIFQIQTLQILTQNYELKKTWTLN